MSFRAAVILVERAAKADAAALEHLLEFFGVGYRTVIADQVSADTTESILLSETEVLFSSAVGFVLALKTGQIDLSSIRGGSTSLRRVFVYAGPDSSSLSAAYASLFGTPPCTLVPQPAGGISLTFTDRHTGFCGPFSGLHIKNISQPGVTLLSNYGEQQPIVSDPIQGNAAGLLHGISQGRDIFLSASTRVLNVDLLSNDKYFDIKRHFFELLPFILFIKYAFPDEIYRSDGVKACLIVDDPALVGRYGHFDYREILEKMSTVGFTTNVGFIPWNYRGSSPQVANLVRSNPNRISISVHGCDHTKAEFGTRNASTLDWLARTALSRMESHEERHRLNYDRVMIFPQGVFSAESATSLKRSNYWAAVNTDPCAAHDAAGVPIRELMDLAITSYSGFPLITRRYFWHGMENFAFDILLEKPCLIVTHQEDFKSGSQQILGGLDALSRLNTSLQWAPLSNVIQTSHKRQRRSNGAVLVRIYSHFSVIQNNCQSVVETTFSKAEPNSEMIDTVLLDGKPTTWKDTQERCVVACTMKPGQTVQLQFQYKSDPSLVPFRNSLMRRGKVMLRRRMTEIRDRYLS